MRKPGSMKQGITSLLLAALFCGLAGSAWAGELIVSAAASLSNAFAELGKAYERTDAGNRIVLNFGGSGQLLQQIERGAPVHVFASADQETMNRAQARNLLENGTRTDFTRNALVMIAPSDAGLSIAGLEGLVDERVRRIAISNPDSVPVGRYTREVLVKAGLWNGLQPKIINTQHVRQSLDYVARGEVDAGFVYATDAAIMSGKVSVLAEIPTVTPISYPVAVVRGNGQNALGRRFIAFLKSDAAQAILARNGFLRP